MATLLIGYDLDKAGDYSELIKAIKSIGAGWWHHLDSTWLVKTTLTPREVRNKLGQYLDEDDELLVIDVSGRSRAWRGFNDRGSRWLRESFK